MPDPTPDPAHALAAECPQKIMGLLHAKGLYAHGTSARFPGKVLCFHRDAPLPGDWAPTEAQARLDAAKGDDAARAYDTAARELFGEFACLNLPGGGSCAEL